MWQREVRDHEPWSALDGRGVQGLGCLQAICQDAAAMLAPNGFLALETGGGDGVHALNDFSKVAGTHALTACGRQICCG